MVSAVTANDAAEPGVSSDSAAVGVVNVPALEGTSQFSIDWLTAVVVSVVTLIVIWTVSKPDPVHLIVSG